MSFEQPEHLTPPSDSLPLQIPMAQAPMTILPSASISRPMIAHPTSPPATSFRQANGTSKPEDTTAQPTSAPIIDRTRPTGSEPDNATVLDAGPLRDIDPQIVEALRGKDRIYVLKLGEVMESLINDERRQRMELTPVTSYQRLLVHRCSAYYRLTPETDSQSKVIFVYSTVESRIPLLKISELVPAETTTAPAFKIMRRSSTDRRNKPPHQAGSVTGDDGDLSDLEPSETGSLGGRSNTTGGSAKKHMTIEEREAAYNEARSRIFMGFEEKEKAKEKDINSSSSSLSVASGSTKNGGSSTGDADSSSSSPATESEWSGPVRRGDRRQNSGYASASSSNRSIRSSAYVSNGSGSSRNSRAASPSSFQYPSLYEPTPSSLPLYDPVQHSAPAAPMYQPPYGYSYNQGQPNPPYMSYHPYYSAPYPPYSSPPHPQQNVPDPATPSNGEHYPPPPHMSYGPPYMWPHPGQQPVHSPPMQPQSVPPQLPPNGPHPMSSPPSGQPPYQSYMPPPLHPYPYPMPGYYPNQPGHHMPPPPPPPPPHTHAPHMPGPQLFDGRAPNNNTGNGHANGFRNGMLGNGVPPVNNGRPPPRNVFNPPVNGNGPNPRHGAVQPGRASWSYGPGVGLGGMVATGPQPHETVGPRLSNNRRQLNMSNSPTNGRSTSGDDVSSVASSGSSSSRRAQTVNASSQHPLPARPDWAINLKPPHNPRNMSPISPPRSISGSSAQSNYSRHPSHSNPPVSLQLTDFPPLTAMQPSERRIPAGAWGNPPSRPNLSQNNNGIGNEMNSRLDDAGFERPPPKSAELYNPKTPKRASVNVESLAQNDVDGAGAETTMVNTLTDEVAALSFGSGTDCSPPCVTVNDSTSTITVKER